MTELANLAAARGRHSNSGAHQQLPALTAQADARDRAETHKAIAGQQTAAPGRKGDQRGGDLVEARAAVAALSAWSAPRWRRSAPCPRADRARQRRPGRPGHGPRSPAARRPPAAANANRAAARSLARR